MRKIKQALLCLLILALAVTFFMNSSASATWCIVRPYNLLWPTWVPELYNSGPNILPYSYTLDAKSILPVQPSWAWNYDLDYPWFLYNAPLSVGGGLYYWDFYTGFNAFPEPGTGPSPIELPDVWWALTAPFDGFTFALMANQANLSYLSAVTGIDDALGFADLLTPATIWGTPPWLTTPVTPSFTATVAATPII